MLFKHLVGLKEHILRCTCYSHLSTVAYTSCTQSIRCRILAVKFVLSASILCRVNGLFFFCMVAVSQMGWTQTSSQEVLFRFAQYIPSVISVMSIKSFVLNNSIIRLHWFILTRFMASINHAVGPSSSLHSKLVKAYCFKYWYSACFWALCSYCSVFIWSMDFTFGLYGTNLVLY